MKNVVSVWSTLSVKLPNVPKPIARIIPNGVLATWAECLTARIFGMALKTETSRVYSGSWAPFYNLHKMYAGLRDAWLYCGNEQAKSLFLQFCNWAIHITSGLSDEQMERMLGNEHGGMNEVLADAYAITHEQKYLDCAKRFSHKRLFTPMSQRQDCLDNMHANTQVPKVIGFERISELSGNEDYHVAVHSSGIS